MRKWLEVFQNKTTGIPGLEQLAAIDVADETDGGVSVMAELKTIYGTDVIYRFHNCEHDEGGPCRTGEM